MDISVADLFLPTNEMINRRVRQISNIDIDLGEFKAHLDQQFGALYALAQQTDASFLGAVEAQEKSKKRELIDSKKDCSKPNVSNWLIM